MAPAPTVGRRRLLRAAGVGVVATVGSVPASVGARSDGGEPSWSETRQEGPTLVEGDPDAGFNYPYLLSVPSSAGDGEVPILVEPNNTGGAIDDFSVHRDMARRVAEAHPATISERLGVPLLVPVFPRPETEPVDWHHYVHQLDRDTLAIEEGPLERVDRQLLAMVDHASERLRGEGYAIRDRIALDGFSASGNFADRFTVLHPDRVLSVTAGGLNGMALLPLVGADGHQLQYHVGVADVEELTGDPVDLAALDEVNQFYYMGAEDENDTLPYEDAWTDPDLREIARQVYGEDMIEDRFPTCQAAYEAADVSAQFRVYEGVGHDPVPALDDVVEFHRRSIAGEDVADMGQDLRDVDIEAEVPAGTGGGSSGDDPVPGFGAGAAIGGVGGAAYALSKLRDGSTVSGADTE